MRRQRTRLAALIAACTLGVTGIAQAEAAASVRISKVRYDATGSDTSSNSSVNGEYVVLTNYGKTTRTLTGWRIADQKGDGHVFRFPTFRLAAGTSVYVHTGSGSNTAHTLYWGEGWHVWNNTGDTARLYDPTRQVDTCSWRSAGSGTQIC